MRKYMVLAILLGILVSGCQLNQVQEPSIGVILPLTGPAAQSGQETLDGIHLALSETDTPFNLLVEDHKSETKDGINAFNHLVSNHNLLGIVTGQSWISLPLAEYANEHEIIQIAAFTTTPKYSTQDDYTYRISNKAGIESQMVIDYLGGKDVAVFYLNNDFGLGELSVFEKHYSEHLLYSHAMEMGETDFRVGLLKVKELGVKDIVMLTVNPNHAAEIIAQSKELGLDLSFYGIRALEKQDFITLAKEDAEGFVYTNSLDPRTPYAKQFAESFEQTYGYVPSSFSAEGYEAARMFIYAFENCNVEVECARNKLDTIKDMSSVFGNITVDGYGDVQYNFRMKTIRDGKFVMLD